MTQRKGRDQASRIEIPLNCSMIVISPLTRALETFLIAAKRSSLDDVSKILVHPDLRERGRGIPENRMRSEREIARDFGGMRHFKKINWQLVRDLEHHDDREDKTLSRFRTWLASCPESRGHVVVFAHYNTIRCLTKNQISSVSNATPYSCLFLSPSLEIVPVETYDTTGKTKEKKKKKKSKRAGNRLRRAPKLLILCGFPGSGKSTFCRKLIGRRGQTRGPRWIRVSQDDLGSRSACEHEMMVALKRGHHVILDRCNPTESERLQWAKLSMLPLSSVRVVHFATPAHVCLERVASRTLCVFDHFITSMFYL